MSRILAYERGNTEVVVIDTITGSITNLGGALPTTGVIQTNTIFDARGQSLVANFLGDVYAVTLATGNFCEVFKLVAGAWVKVRDILPVVGSTLGLMGMYVNNETLCVACCEIGLAPNTTYYHVESTVDGAAWVQTSLGPLTGVWDFTGTCFRWRQALWIAGGLGIVGFENTPGFVTAAPDGGSDGGIVNIASEAGCFASWDNDLYFLRPETATLARIYRLDPAWDITAPIVPPAWTNIAATGIPPMTLFPITPDGPRPCLFRSLNDDLCVFQSGNTTALSKTDTSSYPAFSDLSPLVPASILALVDASIWLLEDDRRRSNPLQYFMVKDPVTQSHFLMTWDGVNDMQIIQTFPGVAGFNVLFPQDPSADLRIFTDRQPQVHFDPVPAVAVVENFQGQYSLTYFLIDDLSRTCAISPEYSIDGDVWLPMSEGSPGSSGQLNLTSSPAGVSHIFIWDAYIDLVGTFPNMQMRIVPRISGV